MEGFIEFVPKESKESKSDRSHEASFAKSEVVIIPSRQWMIPEANEEHSKMTKLAELNES